MKQNRPNILFFFTDQLRFDAIAAHGNPHIKTPHIDELVHNGTTFTSAYTPSPVCVAARCCLHYGQYPTHTGCWANSPMPMDGRPSYVELLTRAGYRTHAIGKCHFHPDTYSMRGYETREFQEEGAATDLNKDKYIAKLIENGYGYALEPHGIRSEMYYVPQPSRLPQELHPTQYIGDRTIEFLKGQKDADRPFYLFSSFIHPHPPFAPPSPWHTLYRAVDMPLPNLPENYESLQMLINKMQNRYKYRDRGLDMNLLRMMKAYYYACVSFVDYQVGRIMDTLRETGLADNTIIFFAADHGELLGDYGCFGKRSMHNAPARVPLIACGGAFSGGHTCNTPVSLVDIAPTMLHIAEADASAMPLDGVDLQTILDGTCTRRGVYSFFSSFGEVGMTCGREFVQNLKTAEEKTFATMNMMYAEEDYKYIYSAPDNREFLFDEKHDRAETRNYIDDPDCQDTVKALRSTLIDYLNRENYRTLIDGDHFKPLIDARVSEDPDFGLIRQDYHPDYFDYSALDDYIDHPAEH